MKLKNLDRSASIKKMRLEDILSQSEVVRGSMLTVCAIDGS